MNLDTLIFAASVALMMIAGAGIFAAGVLVGARIVWRACGGKGDLTLREQQGPDVQQESTQ